MENQNNFNNGTPFGSPNMTGNFVQQQPNNFNNFGGQQVQPNTFAPQGQTNQNMQTLVGSFTGSKGTLYVGKQKGTVSERKEIIFNSNGSIYEMTYDFKKFPWQAINMFFGIGQNQIPVLSITISMENKFNKNYYKLEAVQGYNPTV